MKKKIKEIVHQIFEIPSWTLKPCGRDKHVELISLLSKMHSGAYFGDIETGEMNVPAIIGFLMINDLF